MVNWDTAVHFLAVEIHFLFRKSITIGSEAHQYSAKVKNKWICNSIPA
jgi:hypothetical protein